MSSQFANTSPAPANAGGALLTPAEVAKRLKVKVSYLDRLRRRHGLPHVHVGKEIRFNLEAVQGWLEQRAKSQGKRDTPVWDALRARLMAIPGYNLSDALNKHLIALACYRGSDDKPLVEALKEVRELGARKVLLAVFNAARHLTGAEYYRDHGALADEGATAEVAQAQIQDAINNRDALLKDFEGRLFDIVLLNVERSLGKFSEGELRWGVRSPAGDARWACLAAEGLTDLLDIVAAIRELCGDAPGTGSVPHESAAAHQGCASTDKVALDPKLTDS